MWIKDYKGGLLNLATCHYIEVVPLTIRASVGGSEPEHEYHVKAYQRAPINMMGAKVEMEYTLLSTKSLDQANELIVDIYQALFESKQAVVVHIPS